MAWVSWTKSIRMRCIELLYFYVFNENQKSVSNYRLKRKSWPTNYVYLGFHETWSLYNTNGQFLQIFFWNFVRDTDETYGLNIVTKSIGIGVSCFSSNKKNIMFKFTRNYSIEKHFVWFHPLLDIRIVRLRLNSRFGWDFRFENIVRARIRAKIAQPDWTVLPLVRRSDLVRTLIFFDFLQIL